MNQNLGPDLGPVPVLDPSLRPISIIIWIKVKSLKPDPGMGLGKGLGLFQVPILVGSVSKSEY